MAHMRGVAPFPELWARRTTFAFEDETLEALSLPDLVAAKKTQRDKDWPMIRRLVDVNYLNHRDDPTPEQIFFWLQELRSPELLIEAARAHPDILENVIGKRPLLKSATVGNHESGALERLLRDEEDAERRRDVVYWKPLREQLERLRREARKV
jgi:hypothetical protein